MADNDRNRWSPEREESLARRDAEDNYYMTQRDALLQQVDAIERLRDMHPRTAELRDLWKRGILESRAELAAERQMA